MALILASNSPRRQELLKNAGIDCVVQPVQINEARRAGESAEDYVRRLASEKALGAARTAPPGRLVLGADTAVVVAGQILGKPADAEDAVRMLRLLAGATHRVLTGICFVRAPEKVEVLKHEVSTVIFNPLTEEEIQNYVASGESLDKAGAYAIQGLASKFVKRVEGCFFNVVGLPVSVVYETLNSLSASPQFVKS